MEIKKIKNFFNNANLFKNFKELKKELETLKADFVDQLKSRLRFLGLTQRTFAKKLGVSESRVSQIMKNPGNLTLETMISWGKAVGLKTGVVLYGEDAFEDIKGPLSGQIFIECWKRFGSPRQFYKI